MGLDLLDFLKTKISKNRKIAFIGTFFATLLIHLYHFANTLPNRDSILNYYADQNIIGSGRWALSIACGISSYFDLPWINGIFSCLFIALTAVVIVSLFQIKNPALIVIVGGLLAAAPSTTETFFFLFTADGYMIALFLASLAVYFSRMAESRILYWILSAACVCVSCGIYQAYVSFALVLAVCYFMVELFQNKYEKQMYYRWIVRQACIYICGLAAYYAIWKLCMHLQGTVANDYQGISEVGTLSLDLLLNGAKSAIRTFKWYFAPWSIFVYGFTPYIALNLIFVLFFLGSIVIAIKESHILSRPWACILILFCLIAIVPFSCIWHFVSDSVHYRVMMLPCMTILFIFAALNFEYWAKNFLKNLFGALLFVIVMNNTLMANIGYFYLELSYERTYAEGLEMMLEIRELQDQYEINRFAVVGQRYAEVVHRAVDEEYGTVNRIGQIQIFSDTLDTSLLIETSHVAAFLQTTFGLDLGYISKYEDDWICESDTVRNMNCWPMDGSIGVIEDVLVIKLSEY